MQFALKRAQSYPISTADTCVMVHQCYKKTLPQRYAHATHSHALQASAYTTKYVILLV